MSRLPIRHHTSAITLTSSRRKRAGSWPSLGMVGMLLVPGGCPSAGIEDLEDLELLPLTIEAGAQPIQKPATNATKVGLGQALFFDRILSGNRNTSCSTCHHPFLGTADGLSLPHGEGGSGLGPARTTPEDPAGDPILIPRNSPDAFNRAGFTTMFWDARVERLMNGSLSTPAGEALLPGIESPLAAQAMFPVTSRGEMRGQPGENELADLLDDDLAGIWSGLMDRLLDVPDYQALFVAAYPDTPASELTFAHAANAIAEFEIDTFTLDDSPFDEYLRGNPSALSADAKRGAILFFGPAGCARCHSGVLLTDEKHHNAGVPQVGPGRGDGRDGVYDYGREQVTNDPADRYKFRTPPLRNVAATGPWMHDGAFTGLEAAVRHMLDPVTSAEAYDPSQLDLELRGQLRREETPEVLDRLDEALVVPIRLFDHQVAQLIAFLESLTSPSLFYLPGMAVPGEVPSGLPVGD